MGNNISEYIIQDNKNKIIFKINNDVDNIFMELTKVKNLSSGYFGNVSKYYDENNGKFYIMKRYFKTDVYNFIEKHFQK